MTGLPRRHPSGEPPSGPLRSDADGRAGLTLIELLVGVAIVAILAVASWPSLRGAVVRADVARGKSNLRTLRHALEIYRVDRGAYPPPGRATAADPIGVLAACSLNVLTTPISYVSPQAFVDPFGARAIRGTAGEDTRRRPVTIANPEESVLYINYPHLAQTLGCPSMDTDGYVLISLGPDRRDSFVVYYPYSECLPQRAANHGIRSVEDTIYDPTNGTLSGGDLAAFGGNPPAPQLVGGRKQAL